MKMHVVILQCFVFLHQVNQTAKLSIMPIEKGVLKTIEEIKRKSV